uniref:N-acetyltransferase domain-containing protein n=1 Tax=Branchiostoma floridae TaxID=7739 RepID=C3YR02_BRAFL|eukprot:XP_002601232.1 hypothetical protein BRAFLDRAFT_95011 [Branchiostoma floridae]
MAVGNAVDNLRENVRDRIRNASAEMFNIVFIGLTGSGKSSLINSMEQAVVGTPANLARVGRGAGGNVTLCLEGCEMFSTLQDNLRDKVKFWDFVGLPNRNDETIRTLISLALDGRIPENQPLINPEYFEMCKEELEDEFPAVQGGPTIQRVVVVCAADEEMPVNLLQATKKAAQPATTASDRNIPLFLLISKVDKMVGDANKDDLSRRIRSARDTLDATNYFFEKATLYHEQTNRDNDPGSRSRHTMATQDSFHLKCREAKHSDYNAVMKMASVDTFRDGFDYLPAKFHQWVNDPQFHVLVAEADDKVVAVYVCCMADGGTYLFNKTMRVAPDLQGKKLMMRIGFDLEKALQLRLHPRLLHLERRGIAKDDMYFQGTCNEVLSSLENKDVLPYSLQSSVVPYQPSDMARLTRPEFVEQILSDNSIVVDTIMYQLSASNLHGLSKRGVTILVDNIKRDLFCAAAADFLINAVSCVTRKSSPRFAHASKLRQQRGMIAVYVCYMTDGGAYLFHKSIRIAPKLQGKKLLTRIGFELEKALQLRLHPRLLHLERHAIADVKRLYLLKGMNRKDICVIASIHLFTVSHDVMYFQGTCNEVLSNLEAKGVLPYPPPPSVMPFQPSDMVRLIRPEFLEQILSDKSIFVDWDQYQLSASSLHGLSKRGVTILVDNSEPAAKSLSYGGSYMTPRGRVYHVDVHCSDVGLCQVHIKHHVDRACREYDGVITFCVMVIDPSLIITTKTFCVETLGLVHLPNDHRYLSYKFMFLRIHVRIGCAKTNRQLIRRLGIEGRIDRLLQEALQQNNRLSPSA